MCIIVRESSAVTPRHSVSTRPLEKGRGHSMQRSELDMLRTAVITVHFRECVLPRLHTAVGSVSVGYFQSGYFSTTDVKAVATFVL